MRRVYLMKDSEGKNLRSRVHSNFLESDVSDRGDRAHGERVLAALKRNGLEEITLVICTTDHGVAYPGTREKDHP